MFQWCFIGFNRRVAKQRKRLNHNKFHDKRRPLGHSKQAILPKKLTQIYHKYLKRAHFAAFFFSFFINNGFLSPPVNGHTTGKNRQNRPLTDAQPSG